ncbi:hypothetical protein [Flavobacterium sp. N502536]|uniref:hypothetical protein n=1 Tax=Flavobacterium sp. N502536 TaxID=2986837 RepID=UPI002221DC0A|nr:hypothetical protein [Flavobacterium sp. N502536]
MKKKILLSLIIISSCVKMNAQWNGTNPVWTTSNVGIGTGYAGVGIISPVEKFTIGEMGGNIAVQDRRTSTTEKFTSGYKFYDYNGESASILLEHNSYLGNGIRTLKFSVNGSEAMRINPIGSLGIGTTNPTSKLYVNANDAGDGITLTHPNSRAKIWKLTSGVENYDHHQFSIKNQNGTYFVIDGNNGNTGIGTITPAYKLDVCGTIRAKEIKVELFSGCDFVFKKDYKLMNLNDLEKFVTTKQHLPEIASEKEMIENGVNMKEFQMKLLQKIEELTLYVIEQNKQIKLQNQEIKKLKAIKKRN